MRIILVCAGGMSTSLLVEAVKKAADDRGLRVDVDAVALGALEKTIPDSSCVLVAPQVRHRLAGIQASAAKTGKPVGLIDGVSYGRIDGKAVLDQALRLVQKP